MSVAPQPAKRKEEAADQGVLTENSTVRTHWTKHGLPVYKCIACDTPATGMKDIKLHWAGKKHCPKKAVKPQESVSVQGHRKRSAEVADEAPRAKQGRGMFTCMLCFKADCSCS